MTILVIGKRRRPIRMGCCSGMSSSQRWADRCPPKAKVTRSNRVGWQCMRSFSSNPPNHDLRDADYRRREDVDRALTSASPAGWRSCFVCVGRVPRSVKRREIPDSIKSRTCNISNCYSRLQLKCLKRRSTAQAFTIWCGEGSRSQVIHLIVSRRRVSMSLLSDCRFASGTAHSLRSPV